MAYFCTQSCFRFDSTHVVGRPTSYNNQNHLYYAQYYIRKNCTIFQPSSVTLSGIFLAQGKPFEFMVAQRWKRFVVVEQSLFTIFQFMRANLFSCLLG